MLTRIIAVLFALALAQGASAQIKAAKIDLGDAGKSLAEAKFFHLAEGLYIFSSDGVWLCRGAKTEAVKTADGEAFKPQGMEISTAVANGALIVPGPGDSMESTAWVIRDGVAKVLMTSGGSPVTYQRFEAGAGEDNSCVKAYCNNKWKVFRVDGTTATDVGLPTTSPGGLMFSLAGVPLFRSRTDGAEIWLLKKDKWERLNGEDGKPFMLTVGTPMTAPQSSTVPTVDHVALADASGTTFGYRLLYVKDTTAKIVEPPAGVIVGVSRLGKKTVIELRDPATKTSALYSVDGTKVSALKGGPDGDSSIRGSGDVILADTETKGGERKYYRLDEKGKKEIKAPKGATGFSLHLYGTSAKACFASVKYERGDVKVNGFARVDEKGGLTEISDDEGNLLSGPVQLFPGPAGLYVLKAGQMYFVAP